MNLQPPGPGNFDSTRATGPDQRPLTPASAPTEAPQEPAAEKGGTLTHLSPRSERLAALNEEFDIRGSNFQVTSGFIDRLESLGFITGNEARDLTANVPPENGRMLPGQATESSRLSGLIDALEGYKQELEEGSAVAQALPAVLHSLQQVESRTGQINPRQLESNANRLDALLNSTPADNLSADRQKQLTQAMDVLLIASRLTQGSTTNAGIEQYLANT